MNTLSGTRFSGGADDDMTMQRTPLLMSRLLDRGAWIAPDAEVVTLTAGGTHRQTYADTRRRAGQLANGLLDLGISFGDRVATFMWNGWRHLELYHAVPSIGAVLHTVNIRLGAGDLEYIVNHAEDRILFVDADLLPILEPLVPAIPASSASSSAASRVRSGGRPRFRTPSTTRTSSADTATRSSGRSSTRTPPSGSATRAAPPATRKG